MAYENIGNDKAIEFQGVLMNAKRHLRNLKDIGINCDVYYSTLEQIKVATENEAINAYNIISKKIENETQSINNDSYATSYPKHTSKLLDATISLTYQKGIDRINSEVEEELKKYDIYLKCHNYCERLRIELKINNDISLDKVKEYAENLLDILRKINASGTRIYSFEENVVESIYDISYDVIKLEMYYLGRSTILDYAKNNLIASSFFSERIEKDIDNKRKNGNVTDSFQALVYDAKSGGNILDDRIVFVLSICSKDNFKNIESRLIDLTRKLNELDIAYRGETASKERKEYDANVYKVAININDKMINKLIKNIVSISLVGSILVTGLGMVAKKNTEKVYKMNTEVLYSTSDIIQTKDEKYEKLDNPETIRIYEYDVWKDPGGLSRYKRKITWYDVTSADADSIDDYLNLNLEDYESHVDYQKSYFYFIRDYDEAIIEVVKLIQNQDPGTDLNFLGSIAALSAIITFFGVAFLDKNNILKLIKEIKDKKENKLEYQKWLLNLESNLEASRRFMAEHKEYEEEFERLYELYKLSGTKTKNEIDEMHLKLTKKK